MAAHRLILRWADAHYQTTGKWPNPKTGAITAVEGESWYSVQWALQHGTRGLPGGDTLARFLARYGRRQEGSVAAVPKPAQRS